MDHSQRTPQRPWATNSTTHISVGALRECKKKLRSAPLVQEKRPPYLLCGYTARPSVLGGIYPLAWAIRRCLVDRRATGMAFSTSGGPWASTILLAGCHVMQTNIHSHVQQAVASIINKHFASSLTAWTSHHSAHRRRRQCM